MTEVWLSRYLCSPYFSIHVFLSCILKLTSFKVKVLVLPTVCLVTQAGKAVDSSRPLYNIVESDNMISNQWSHMVYWLGFHPFTLSARVRSPCGSSAHMEIRTSPRTSPRLPLKVDQVFRR